MDKKNEIANGHDPKAELLAAARDSADREVEAEVMFDQMDESAGDFRLLDFRVQMGVDVEIDPDADPAQVPVLMMRFRASLLSAIDMMQGGIMDLLTGGDFDPAMRLAVSTWGSGGRLLADSVLESVDDWLTENGFPTASLYEVESSNIYAMGWADPHDADTPSVAVVAFEGEPRTLYAYDGVPEETFADWWGSESKGSYLNTEIKDRFPYRKLT